MCAICVLFIKGVRYCDVGVVLISYCCSVSYQSLIHWVLYMVQSYNRSYVHFCVPWILEKFSNDPGAGTTNDFDCCLHQLSIHVGNHSKGQAMILMRSYRV